MCGTWVREYLTQSEIEVEEAANMILGSKIKTCLNLKVGNLRQVSGVFCYIKAHFGTTRMDSAREQKEGLHALKKLEVLLEQLIWIYL